MYLTGSEFDSPYNTILQLKYITTIARDLQENPKYNQSAEAACELKLNCMPRTGARKVACTVGDLLKCGVNPSLVDL